MNNIHFEVKQKYKNENRFRDFGMEILKTMTYEETELFLEPIITEKLAKKDFFDKEYKRLVKRTKILLAPGTFEFEFKVEMGWCMTFAAKDAENKERLDELFKYWQFNEARKPGQEIKNKQDELELWLLKAREFPIEQIYEGRLKHSYNRFSGICPFHQEKTPSFFIFTDRNYYHCFGCGAHGDVISFYQKTRGVDFREAVKYLGGY